MPQIGAAGAAGAGAGGAMSALPYAGMGAAQIGTGLLGSQKGEYKWGQGLPSWLKKSLERQAKIPTEQYQAMLFGQGKSAMGKQMQGLSQALQEQYARRGLTGSGLEMSGLTKLGQAELEQIASLANQSALQANQMKQSALQTALGVPSNYQPSWGQQFAPYLMEALAGMGYGQQSYWNQPTPGVSTTPTSTGSGGLVDWGAFNSMNPSDW